MGGGGAWHWWNEELDFYIDSGVEDGGNGCEVSLCSFSPCITFKRVSDQFIRDTTR